MFGEVYRCVKEVQYELAVGNTAAAKYKLLAVRQAINSLPSPPYSRNDRERFGNVVEWYLDGQQAGLGAPDLSHLEDLMRYVQKNPNIGKLPGPGIKLSPY